MLIRLAITLILFYTLSSICVSAQTSAFTYQGRLTDNGTQPTGTYDMEFRLFDALEGGNPLPQGNPITITFTDPPRGVSVANGVFTVQLDFGGATAFDGGPRWLQIAVKKPTDSSFVPLNPRQAITSTPYAITATPTAGSGNYIQNGTSPQTTSNFNISGNGTVGGTLSANVLNTPTIISGNGSVGTLFASVLTTSTINSPGSFLRISGVVQLVGLGTAGAVALCFNPSNVISLCSSSIRYKDNINNFSPGLDLIRRLRPVSFNWKANNQADMGLVAEEVADVEPLLVTHNNKGEIEGVKYDRVGVVLINAVKEQQAQIEDQRTLIQSQQKLLETQQRQLEQQQKQFEALKGLVCSMNANAEICKKEQ
jgi:hypothetical protein